MEGLLIPSSAGKVHTICIKSCPSSSAVYALKATHQAHPLNAPGSWNACMLRESLKGDHQALCSGKWLTQRLIPGQRVENKCPGMFGHKWGIYVIYAPANTQETLWKSGWKD